MPISYSFYFLLVMMAFCSGSAEAQLSEAKPIKELRFGEQSDDTMVLIIGGDVAHVGKYYVPKGFGLKSVLGLVGGFAWNGHRTHIDATRAQFAGNIEVIHKKTPDKKVVYAIKDLQKAKFPDIELQEGDIINIQSIRLYEE